MRSAFLVRQDLTRGESHRVSAVLSRMRETDEVSSVLSHLGLHLTEAALGRSSDGPYLYYRIEAGDRGSVPDVYRAVLEASEGERDAVAETLRTFDRLTDGEPYPADFSTSTTGTSCDPHGGHGPPSDRGHTEETPPAED